MGRRGDGNEKGVSSVTSRLLGEGDPFSSLNPAPFPEEVKKLRLGLTGAEKITPNATPRKGKLPTPAFHPRSSWKTTG